MNTSIIISFLSDLKENNNRDWFQENKPRYEEAKNEMLNITDQLISSIVQFDDQIAGMNAKDCLFRIYRDVRFSKDKSPYKTNMGSHITKGGRKGPYAGYYIHLEPGGSFIAGGMYGPQSDVLKKIREDIDYHFDEFKAIVEGKEFYNFYGDLMTEDKLKRPPKGFDADNPAIEYLKLKSITSFRRLTDEEVLGGNIKAIALEGFKLLHPLNQFLNRVI